MPVFIPMMMIAALFWFTGYDGLLSLWLMGISIGILYIAAKFRFGADWLTVPTEFEQLSLRDGARLIMANGLGFAAAWALNVLTKPYIVNFADRLFSPIAAWMFGGKPSP